MAGKADKFKGRAKEAAGDVTDDERLKRRGTADRAGGRIKEFLDDAREKGEEIVDKVKEKVNRR